MASDNLESKQFSRLVDLISEGEIEGFPSARTYTRDTDAYNRALLKDIYLDKTSIVREGANADAPYQDADFNFRGVNVTTRYGTGNQTYISEIGNETEQEVSVGAKLVGWELPSTQNPVPVVRTISDANVDAVRLTISVPSLQTIHPNGQIVGMYVDLKVEVAYGAGAYTTVIEEDRIEGRTTNLYQRDYIIDLTSTTRPVNIRLTKSHWDSGITSGGSQVFGDMFWVSLTKIIRAKTAHPHSALVGLRFDSQSFGNVPERSYRIRGIKIAIPSNATVNATNGRLTYAGIWDGTFQSKKWCSDPAWILWDLLTSKRFGFGDHITADSLDKFSFFSASVYANALVPDGLGGQEPRFSCNVNIQTQEEAYKLINDLCSVFRSQPYWSTGSLAIAQDRPTDPTFIFNQGNVTPEGFSYSGSSLKTRHTVAVVSYFDMDIRDTAKEMVEDSAGIAKYGINKIEIEAFACTSRGQARRVGEWLLYAEQRQGEVISFNTGMAEGTQVRPGQVIQVADPVKAGRFRAGRIKSGTAQVLTLDRSAEQMFADGMPATFEFSVMLPTGVSQTITGINGTALNGSTLTLPSTLDLPPPVGAMWAISTSTLQTQIYRVLTVQEQDGGQTFAISALLHEDSKYDYIERDVPLQTRDITELDVPPAAPTGLTASELLYENNGQVLSKIIVSWTPQAGVARFIFRYRFDNGNYTTVSTTSPDYDILNSDIGTYNFELQAESGGFKRSATVTASFNALGKTAPPATIPDLSIAPIDDKNAELHWPQATDLDVRIGGQIRIRYTAEIGANATWGRAIDIVPAVAGSSTRKIVPLLEGTYLIRAVDSTNNESAGVASVVVDLPAPQDMLLIQEYREDNDSPPFQGSSTNMFYSTDENGLTLTATGVIDEIPSFDEISSIDFYGSISPTGTYQFVDTLDLLDVYDIDLQLILKTRAIEPGSFVDEQTELLDTWDDIDGSDLSAVNAALYVRSTNNSPVGLIDSIASFDVIANIDDLGGVFTEWQPFVNGTTRGRAFQFKLEATSTNPAQNIVVEELGVLTQFQRRIETQRNLSSGAAAFTVTYPTPFYATPSIGITAQNMATGDFFTIGSATRTGFAVTFKNSGGSMVSKTFDYQAVGHGRQII